MGNSRPVHTVGAAALVRKFTVVMPTFRRVSHLLLDFWFCHLELKAKI